MSKITLVTGIWNIGRDELTEGWSRTYQHYLDKFSSLLGVDANMIIFGDEELRDFVFERRSKENTQFIVRGQEWFKNDFYTKIQKIRLLTFSCPNIISLFNVEKHHALGNRCKSTIWCLHDFFNDR